jgi:hypothetical protein
VHKDVCKPLSRSFGYVDILDGDKKQSIEDIIRMKTLDLRGYTGGCFETLSGLNYFYILMKQ